MDLLVCEEDMMPETPEGVLQGPENISEIRRQRQLSCDLKFSNDEPGPIPNPDPTLINPKIIQEMILMERVLSESLSPCIFSKLQPEVNPSMRSDTVCWLHEVCDAEDYSDAIFLRAVSYMDRILSSYSVKANQLQLLGVVCLSLSLKFQGVRFLMDKLIYYTADSVDKELMKEWEYLVLFALQWDINIILPTSFLEVFQNICPKEWFKDEIKAEISTLLGMCAVDTCFILDNPSHIAIAALVFAISRHISQKVGQEALLKLTELTRIPMETIHIVLGKVSTKFHRCCDGPALAVTMTTLTTIPSATITNTSPVKPEPMQVQVQGEGQGQAEANA